MNHTFGNGTMRDVKRHFREVEKAKKAEVRELRAKTKGADQLTFEEARLIVNKDHLGLVSSKAIPKLRKSGLDDVANELESLIAYQEAKADREVNDSDCFNAMY